MIDATSGTARPNYSREQALQVAENMIAAAASWSRPEFQAGYFEGLVGAWRQCGLLSEHEKRGLVERMRANLPGPPAAWWDLANRLGL